MGEGEDEWVSQGACGEEGGGSKEEEKGRREGELYGRCEVDL